MLSNIEVTYIEQISEKYPVLIESISKLHNIKRTLTESLNIVYQLKVSFELEFLVILI